jgi:putative SOS response-associated peptidase YedK
VCGRYYIDDEDRGSEIYALTEKAQERGKSAALKVQTGEIFPTYTVPAIANDRNLKPAVFPMFWGFPSPSGGAGRPLINARSESADEKPMFRESAARRRCLLPASCYYEWTHGEGPRTKMEMYRADRSVLYLGGLYILTPEHPLGCFVILTRQAAPEIAFVHDRMPVIIPHDKTAAWLSQAPDYRKILECADIAVICREADVLPGTPAT